MDTESTQPPMPRHSRMRRRTLTADAVKKQVQIEVDFGVNHCSHSQGWSGRSLVVVAAYFKGATGDQQEGVDARGIPLCVSITVGVLELFRSTSGVKEPVESSNRLRQRLAQDTLPLNSDSRTK